MISAGEFTTFSSTLPEWVPEWFARKMCARDGFETLELLADAALLDLSVSYVPRFLSPAPSPAIPQFSMLFSDTLSSYRLVSPSASSNASISPNTSPRTSPVISPASTPNTSSINTPCNGPPVLPSRSLEDEFACQLATLARDGKRVKFADPKDAPCDAPATRLRPRRATGASTTAATQARKHRRSEEDEEKWAAAGLVPAKKARLAKASEEPVDEKPTTPRKPSASRQASRDHRIPCPYLGCVGVYTEGYELERHIPTHLPDMKKPFQCPECSYAAVQKRNLKDHMERKHLKDRYRNIDAVAEPRARRRAQKEKVTV